MAVAVAVGLGVGVAVGARVAVGAGVHVAVGGTVGVGVGAMPGDSGISTVSGAPGVVTSVAPWIPGGTSKTSANSRVWPASTSSGTPSSIVSSSAMGIVSPPAVRTANQLASTRAVLSCSRVRRTSTTRYTPSGS